MTGPARLQHPKETLNSAAGNRQHPGPNMVRNMRETLADATKAGDVASMSRIIRRGGAQIDALTTVRGYDVPISPLMLAVMQGNAQCMDLLIGAGADVNQRCGCHPGTFSAPSFAVQTSRCRHAKLPRATLASSCASPHPSPDLSLSLFRRLL
jgi:hypothetical protein